MTLSGLFLFVGIYAMAVFSPGPAIAAVIARVLSSGLRRNAPFIWGIVAGDLVWFAMVTLGLSALAENFHILFLGGLALTLGNPKVMVFFISILPIVVDLAQMTPLVALEITLLIATILSSAMWTYAIAAERARGLIASPRAMKLVNRGTGTVMAGAAVAVATRS